LIKLKGALLKEKGGQLATFIMDTILEEKAPGLQGFKKKKVWPRVYKMGETATCTRCD